MNLINNRSNALKKVLCILLVVFSYEFLIAQQLAFPAAVGAGAYTVGGRGGIVVHVTNLNAAGPGSFKEALQMTVPRTIVFDVSGVINIDKFLYLSSSNSNFTIAGQSAPEGGITIAGGRVYFSDVSNYIMRHIRFKGGFQADWIPNNGDGLGSASFSGVGAQLDIIVDHVSFGFGKTMPTWTQQGDDNRAADKVTIQNSLFSESDKGAIIGRDVDQNLFLAGNMTFSKNVFYNVKYRTPNTNGMHEGDSSFDIINNLSWNNQGRIIRGAGNLHLNHINNATYIRTNTTGDTGLNLWSQNWVPQIYTTGNFLEITSTGTLTNTVAQMNTDNTLSWKVFDFNGPNYGNQLPANFFVNNPYPIKGASQTILNATDLRLTLPNDVGCNARLNADGTVSSNLDTHDAEYLGNILNDVMVTPLNVYILNPIQSVLRPSNFYQSNPHIPEIWFQANVPAGQDHNDFSPSGYTWLEEYLNQVDGDIELPDPVAVTGVGVSPNTATLNINGTTSLTATVTPANASNRTGVWSSENEGMATVNQSGIVTGVTTGDTTITFTTNDGNFTGTALITVTSELEPEPELPLSYGFYVRETMQELVALTPGVTSTIAFEDIDGLELSFAAVDTDNFSGSFRITFDGQIKIENVDPYTTTRRTFTEGLHTAQYEIFSELNAQGDLLDTIELNVLIEAPISEPDPISVTAVIVSPNTTELQVSETIALTATITPDDATNQTGVWSSSDASVATVDANGVVTAVSVGVVSISFTTDDGGFTDTSDITVFPEALQASAGENQQICIGESATLTASGGTNYVWSTGETTATIEVIPTETTIYTVTVSDDNNQTDQASVTVTVNAIPIANAGEDQTICEGEIITLTASGGNTYLWSTGETTASIEVIPTEETVYTVEVFSNNCSSADTVTVFTNESPNLTISENVVIVEGESTILTVSGADNYEWNTGETTASITVSPVSTTTYSVASVGVNGCVSNAEVVVTVIPELIANAGNDVTICSGESVTLNATGGSSYTWNTGDTGAELSVSPSTTTTYTVTVSDILGNSETDSVTITVNEVPNVSVSENVTIMEGESTTLTANGAASYVWSTAETSNTITVSPLSTTTYTVTGVLNGCEATAEVTVTVIPELIANAGNDVTICSGESVTLNATGGSSYTWNTGETNAELNVSPSVTTTYTVTVSDTFGNSDTDSVTVTVNETPNLTLSSHISIIEGQSTSLSVSGASTYLWSTGQTSNTITVSPVQTTTYTVTGTSNSCSAESAVTVTVEPLFTASAGSDERVCDNDSYEVVLTASQGDSYLWSTGATTQSIVVSPLSTSIYTVTVTQGIQEDTDSVTVYVDPSPNVVISNGANVAILNGDFVTLSATGANTYEWNNGATQPNIAVSPTATTTYEVKGYIGNCYDQKQVAVTVFQRVVANAGEDVFMCLNDVATLTAEGGDEYLWSTGETTQSIEVSPEQTTEYTVTVFNAMHFDEDTVRVEVDASCDINQFNPNDETNNQRFDMFPNPASKMVHLRFPELYLASEVNIYDLSGVIVRQTKIDIDETDNTTQIKIDISSLQAGVYLVRLLVKDDVIHRKLIVK